MKQATHLLIGFLMFATLNINAQSVGIGTTTPAASAQLDISSTTKGVLVPRVTTAEMNAIAAPDNGLMVYNTTAEAFAYRTASGWVFLNGSATAANGWSTLGNAGINPANNFIGTTDDEPVVVRQNNLRAGLLTGSNTSWGVNALNPASTGSNNTANGLDALRSNTTGFANTANGGSALYSNTIGSGNTANGVQALRNNTTGNSNTANGFQALFSNTTGSSNTANGLAALRSNTTGNDNTANGAQALWSNTTGGFNTANGWHTLLNNTSGNFNTANGVSALESNSTGSDNTANGSQALYSNTTGIQNTANGRFALLSNTTGNSNTANGFNALRSNTTGNGNTANGRDALFSNTTGTNNTANGKDALRNNTTGFDNTANGSSALSSNTTGTNNTAIGRGADVTSGDLTNATAIGYDAKVNASNKIRLGNTAVTVIEGQVPFTHPSDGRFKTNVSESDVKGLDFIIKLRPVVYNLDTRKFNAFARNGMPGAQQASFIEEDYGASTSIRQSGFIAQEVEKAAREAGYNFNGIHTPENDKDYYSLAYSQFVVPLVKGMQEQQQMINVQQQQIDDLKKMVEQLLKEKK